jgi:UDP-3-O-[3-hydroxymyristoyl] glucosamine N-acyltransferase
LTNTAIVSWHRAEDYQQLMIKLIGFKQATLTNDIAGCIKTSTDVEIITPEDFLAGQFDLTDEFIVTVVRDLELRKNIIKIIDESKLKRATWIHSTALIDSTAQIQPGTFIGPFSSVFCQTQIGKDCIIGPYSMVSHQVILGNSCLLHPGTMIAGTVTVGNCCTFGVRSTILDKINICDEVYIGGGSLVNKNIEIAGCYVGSPARKIARQTDFLAIDTAQIK